MSTTIDQRVVEMRFDNKQFESNVATTMSTLDKLKKSLHLDGASKGLEDVNSAAKKVDMSGLGSAVENVRAKFSALEIMGVTALVNITNSAVNAGKRIVSALTIDPVKMGLSEYETQIGAIQTILANTESKGTTLDDVNGALDELNTYADKTIYNFTEMTRNIGTFTAAGIDLDKSVSSIKGIANLAAISGSTSQQASTAMYQLSQAMASGTVKLMDWNSVVNAGMGGQVFQDALKRTAKAHGVAVDDIIKKHGSFRESLSEGWITADILTETLTHFTMAAEEGSKEWEELKASLKEKGYTDDQAAAILKMANTATGAATEVKTFTQLWDTLKESAQSGWSQTWEIIIGDFEEAKEFLTELSDLFGGIIGASAEARNDMLENWKVLGGRTDLIDSFRNIVEGIQSIVKPIKEAFRDIFPAMTAEKLKSFTEGLKNLTDKLKISDDTADKLKRTFKGIFAIFDIAKQIISAVFKAVSSLFGTFGDLGGGVLSVTATFGDWIVKLNESIRSSGIFVKAFQGVADILKAVIKLAMKFVKLLVDGIVRPGWDGIVTLLQNIRDRMSGVIDAASGLKDGVVNAFDAMGSAVEGSILVKIFEGLWKALSIVVSAIGKLFGSIAKSIGNSFNGDGFEVILNFINALSSSAIIVFIAKLAKGLSDTVESFGSFKDGILGILDDVRGCFKAYQDQIKAGTLMKIAQAIAILVASLFVLSMIDEEKLSSAIGAITVLFAELLGSMAIIGKIKLGKGMFKLGYTMKSLAMALLILAAAMKIMSTMSLSEMGVALLGLAAGLAGMVIAVNLLPEKKVRGAASAIQKMSSALLILAVAIKIMSTMSWEEMAIGLITMVVGLGALVAAVNLLPKSTALRALGMISLATAMLVLAGALKIMGTMSWREMAVSLAALAGSLAILTVAMKLMKKAIPGAAAMLIIAPALILLATSLKIMGSMSLDSVVRGLIALGGAMVILATGLKLMKHTLAGSASMVIAAAALSILAPVLLVLGSMKWTSIAKGLTMLAGAFAVIGIAGLLLKPVIPSILKLSAAMVLIGVAVLAAGVGLTAFGIGLTAIATGITTLAASLTSVASAIIKIIKTIFIGIAEGIVAFCGVIADGMPIIGNAIKELVLTICDVLIECAPVIVDTILELIVSILDSLSKYAPKIIAALFKFVMSLFEGVVEALRSIDTETLIKGILSIGLIAALMHVLSSLVSLVPGAMAGVIGAGIVIAELALVLAAIGALGQIPGLKWLVSEGGDFLQVIGTAIGQFIGGIAGGIAQGFTSSLPRIGTSLSTFMNNLQPFIDGVRKIDASVVNGVKSLVAVILAMTGASLLITGANIIESLTSWFTGGSSVSKFAEELPVLGAGLKGFSDSVAGISAENIMAAANAAKALAVMTACIPNEGGVVSWFAGENSISQFADEIVNLGRGLKRFSDETAGMNPEGVIAAANAAKVLANMTNTIPNSGGVVSWFAGDNSISEFGDEIAKLGKGLKGFSDETTGVNPEGVIAAVNAAKSLANMTNTIPNSGGVGSWFAGDNSISQFADEIVKLGRGLKGFSDETAGVNPETVIAAANAAKSLANMTNTIPNSGGVGSWFAGDNSVSKFADEIVKLGRGIKGFSDETAGVDPETVVAASNAAKSLASMTNTIPNSGGVGSWFAGDNSVSKFADELRKLGTGLLAFSKSATGVSVEVVKNAATAASELIRIANGIPNTGGVGSWFAGDNDISEFGDKLPRLGAGILAFSKSATGVNVEVVKSAAIAAGELVKTANGIPNTGGVGSWFAGDNDISKFGDKLPSLGAGLLAFSTSANGISAENVKAASVAAGELVKAANNVPNTGGVASWFAGDKDISEFGDRLPALGRGIKGFSDSINGLNPENVTAGANATKTLVQVANSAPKDTSKLASFGGGLKSFGSSLKLFFAETAGITAERAKNVTEAVSAVEQITNFDSSKVNATTDSINGFVDAIKSMSGVAKNAASGVNDVLNNMAEMSVKSVKDSIPEMKAVGKDIVKSFGEGIEETSSVAEKACKTLASNCVDAIRDKRDSFESAGKYVVSGFAEGISANTFTAKAEAKAMAKAALRAAEEALDENSPSKEFYRIGSYGGEGFVNGLSAYGNISYDAGSEMAGSAKAGLQDAISRIGDALDGNIDLQPTIRPVLDLSDVKSGAGSLSSLFGDSSVGVLANVNSVSSMMNRRGQNGANGDVVSAINTLGKKLDNVGNTNYNINGVTYDDGSNITDAVKTIVRAARVERRI